MQHPPSVNSNRPADSQNRFSRGLGRPPTSPHKPASQRERQQQHTGTADGWNGLAHVLVDAAPARAGCDFVRIERAAINAVEHAVGIRVIVGHRAAADAGIGLGRVVRTRVTALRPNAVVVVVFAAIGQRPLCRSAHHLAVGGFVVRTAPTRQTARLEPIDDDKQAVVGERVMPEIQQTTNCAIRSQTSVAVGAAWQGNSITSICAFGDGVTDLCEVFELSWGSNCATAAKQDRSDRQRGRSHRAVTM